MKNQPTYRPSPTALLNPCADPIFKILFTTNSKDSHEALTLFLSDLIGQTVSDVVLQPNELAGESTTDKQAEFDINCKIDSEVVNIEMQGRNIKDDYGKRTEYHVAHLLNHYTPKGFSWEETPKAYQISILNFIFDEQEKNSFNKYLMRNEHGRTISKTLNILFLELPKVLPLNDDVQKLTEIEMWGKFFLYANRQDKQDFIKELAKANRGIQMAVRVLHSISEDELNWYRESSYWMRVSDDKTMKNAAQKAGHAEGLAEGRAEGLTEGRAEGLAEGRAKGLAEGRAKGLAEGRAEGLTKGREEGHAKGLAEGEKNKTIEIANNAIAMGFSPEQIQKMTGLSLETIKELQKK